MEAPQKKRGRKKKRRPYIYSFSFHQGPRRLYTRTRIAESSALRPSLLADKEKEEEEEENNFSITKQQKSSFLCLLHPNSSFGKYTHTHTYIYTNTAMKN